MFVVPSRLESGNSNASTDTAYWLKLAEDAPANTSVTVYMGFLPMNEIASNCKTVNEAPQLSTYAGRVLVSVL